MSYTAGVKTSVSIPEDVFKEADRIARRLKMNRSELYATALREFIRRQILATRLRRVYGKASDPLPESFERAQAEILEHEKR